MSAPCASRSEPETRWAGYSALPCSRRCSCLSASLSAKAVKRMRTRCVAALILFLQAGAAVQADAQYLQGDGVRQGITGCTASCNQAQSSSLLNQGLSAMQIHTYCSCFCTQMATRLTQAELAS